MIPGGGGPGKRGLYYSIVYPIILHYTIFQYITVYYYASIISCHSILYHVSLVILYSQVLVRKTERRGCEGGEALWTRLPGKLPPITLSLLLLLCIVSMSSVIIAIIIISIIIVYH